MAGCEVLLVLAMPFQTGGFLTYTLHWQLALQQMGVPVHVVRPCAKRDESQQRRRGNLTYSNMTSATVVQYARHIRARGGRVFVPAVWQSYSGEANEWQAVVEQLVDDGAWVAYHHPSDVTGWVGKLPRLITIGTQLARLGGGTYVKHPYVRHQHPPVPVTGRAICPSRIHTHKRSGIVLEAAVRMGGDLVVCGSLSDRWERVRWLAEYPGWTDHWMQVRDGVLGKTVRGSVVGHGGYAEHEAHSLLRSHRVVVDLTDYSEMPGNDGGRSQYLFLEAWDCERPLVVHRGWLNDADPTVRHGENCWAIGTVDELVDAIYDERWQASAVAGGVLELQKHSPRAVVPHLLEVLYG